LGVAAPVYAQQAPAPAADATAKPAANAPAAPPVTTAPAAAVPATAAPKAADDVPSAAVLKKARAAGYHTRIKRGNVVYCKTETVLGSHFTSESCIDEDQLEATLLHSQAQRDDLMHTVGTPTRTP